ncbi:MAG: hypothetical protein WBG42_09955, partial [Cryomorphaceae bacterium]
MKNLGFTMIVLVAMSCSSATTLEDVQKQEEKARADLMDAKEEMVELAEAKEEYSVDSRDQEIKELENRQKTIKKDIKNIKNVESESLASGKETMIDEL